MLLQGKLPQRFSFRSKTLDREVIVESEERLPAMDGVIFCIHATTDEDDLHPYKQLFKAIQDRNGVGAMSSCLSLS